MDPLLESAQRGDEAALEALQRRFAPDVKGYVHRHVGVALRRKISHADLCQETFVRVFRSLGSLPHDASLQTLRARLMRTAEWVIRDAARALDHLEGESRSGPRTAATLADPASEGSMGEVTRDDASRWLHRLLDRLAPPYAEVVRQRLRGDDFRTIADRLGEQEATVRKRYERATRQLRQLVEPGGDA